MQQLNILPVKVSQNVDIKDDATALTPPLSKDDFSQYIDLHIAKNKDIGDSEKEVTTHNVEPKVVQKQEDKKAQEVNEKSQDKSSALQGMSDETDLTNAQPKLAASGSPNEKEVIQEAQAVDESDLLMSFLTKADKTLIDHKSVGDNNSAVHNNLVDDKKTGDTSVEPKKELKKELNPDLKTEEKAKQEAQLLLKSSDLVADLSSVAKAIKSLGQEKPVESLLAQPQSKKTLSDIKQVTINALNGSSNIKNNDLEAVDIDDSDLDGSVSKVSNLVSEKGAKFDKVSHLVQEIKTPPINEKGSVESITKDITPEELIKAISTQQLKDIAQEVNHSNKLNTGSEKISTQELSQKNLNLAEQKQGTSNTSSSPLSKAPINVEKITSVDNSLEIESNINDKIVKQMQGDNTSTKPETTLSAANTIAHNTNNKNLSAANLGQNQVASKAELKASQSSLADSDVQLNTKALEQFIEQNKEVGTSETKNVGAKTTVKANTDFTMNGSLIDTANRTAQAVYDRTEQQIADNFNVTGSAETSQGQKTNTQLHHETISIFRKDFADAVKDKVMLIISQKLQQFDIKLDPPELGNVQVRVNLQGEQATVSFVVQNQQAKEALEQNMHKLKDSLAEQGVDVGDANVEQQSQQSGNEEASNGNDNTIMTNTAEASDVIEHSLSARMFDSSTTAVDYYA